MDTYIALLRGINISGKNPVAMGALKEGFEALHYSEVKTYINSGNVVFSTDTPDEDTCAAAIRAMMAANFGLDIPVLVMRAADWADILAHAPDWWGTEDKDIYDNVIFLLPPTETAEVVAAIGEAKPGIEKIAPYRRAIFWSFVRKDYAKTNWIKTASSVINDRVTIRTANTVRKLAALCKKG